ncbi:MAG: L,D-transpeptidase [Phyllobacteriaceae bacterium]|nr:L,D-transpeptidase [Phyllobacteriaceae bacterium]
MKLRHFVLAAAFLVTGPAIAATSDLDPLGTLKGPAASQPANASPAPVVKKKKVASKAKKPVKAAKTKKAEPKVVEKPKPKGLFATLFGAPSEAQQPQLKSTAKSKDVKAKEKEIAALKAKKADAKAIKAKEKELAALKAKEAKASEVAMAKAKDAKAKEVAALKAKEAAAKAKKAEGTQVASTDAPDSFKFGLFGQSSKSVSSSNPDTLALDDLQAAKDKTSKFRVKDEFKPAIVPFAGSYKPGTIVVKTDERRLYLVEGGGMARRYAIAVGKEGLQFEGKGVVGDKQEWPRWIPTKEMVERDPKHYGKYKDGMDGGPENPLGARAIYLYQGQTDTHIRVHGTIAPNSVGTAASNGCFRMINSHVIDLYGRVKMGAEFVVL